MIRWLAILALLWPLSAAASGVAHAPAAGSEIATVQSAAIADALDCPPMAAPTHVHCHHATHGSLAANSVSPEDRDDSADFTQSEEVSPPLAAAASITGLRFDSRPADQPSFILFGNFRS